MNLTLFWTCANANIRCLRGWRLDADWAWCRQWIMDDSTSFIGLLPMVVVSWQSSDLSVFTPTSAPVLPASDIARYETWITVRSRSSVVAARVTSEHNANATKPPAPISRHSKGAVRLLAGTKAGIIIGAIVIAFLLLVAMIFFFLRHVRRSRELRQSRSPRQYIHDKLKNTPWKNEAHELATSEKSHEVSADREPQEFLAGPRPLLPLPIPLTSKPRTIPEAGSRKQLSARDGVDYIRL